MATSRLTLARYRELLGALERHLRANGVPHWPPILAEWLSQLDALEQRGGRESLLAHLMEAKKATGGMGSLGDIVICPESGYSVGPDERQIKAANAELLRLVHELFKEITRLINILSAADRDKY